MGLLLLAVALFFLPPLPAELQSLQRRFNLRLLDRNGRLLRVVASDQASAQQWKSLEQFSPWLVQATLTAEDRHFYQHPGLDPWGIGRAFRANWRAGRIVQGGSTISQQLVRLLRSSDSQRGWRDKLSEAYWALRLERRYSKREILEAYLNLAPYGLQTYGAEAAAQLYLGKPASQLSLAESSFLAVLPRAPESFLPYQHFEEIEPFQKQLLGQMEVAPGERERALREPIALQPLESTFEAGHFCDYVLSRLPRGTRGELRTTLDLPLQHEVEGIVSVHLKRLRSRGVSNAAVVVMEVDSGAVLAMVGSGDYSGFQFNACLSGRQAGSSLKPFTYALALERSWTPASILPDLNLYPKQVESGYIPRNYDERFHGPVRLREALACSYNVPVVRLLESMGVQALLDRLRLLGFARLRENAEHYGLGLTLGVGEISLLELVRAYRCLARQGLYGPEKALLEETPGSPPSETSPSDVLREGSPPSETSPHYVFEPGVAALITDILRDDQARAPAFGLGGPLHFPFQCAVKTGTTKGYRDNWTVGYTPIYVVGCWVGNFDGTSMRNGVSGVTGAGPIFHDVMTTLVERDQGSPDFSLPDSVQATEVCPESGQLPGPDCPHRLKEVCLRKHPIAEHCQMHQRLGGELYCLYPPLYRAWALGQGIPQPPVRHTGDSQVSIAFPDNGAVFRLDGDLRRTHQALHLRVLVPDWCERVDWEVGETHLSAGKAPFDAWWPLQPGGYLVRATAYGKERQEASSAIRILVRQGRN